MLEANSVTLYSTENNEKSSVADRWNRTMKRIMWKYFTANNTNNYIDKLQNMVECTTLHITGQLSSVHQMRGTHQTTSTCLQLSMVKPPFAKFHVGEKVRIVRKKDTFEKGFTPNWTEEVFTVSEVKHTNPITYSVKDELGEPIKGTFYEQELQSSVQEIFRIERVLRKKKNQVYVKVTITRSIRGYQ